MFHGYPFERPKNLFQVFTLAKDTHCISYCLEGDQQLYNLHKTVTRSLFHTVEIVFSTNITEEKLCEFNYNNHSDKILYLGFKILSLEYYFNIQIDICSSIVAGRWKISL